MSPPYFCTIASTNEDTFKLLAALESLDIEECIAEPNLVTVSFERAGDSLKSAERKGEFESLTEKPEVVRDPRRDDEVEEVRGVCFKIRDSRSIWGGLGEGERRIGRRKPSEKGQTREKREQERRMSGE